MGKLYVSTVSFQILLKFINLIYPDRIFQGFFKSYVYILLPPIQNKIKA